MNKEDGAPCPCCLCVHVRHAPTSRRRDGNWLMAAQALVVMAGLAYLAICQAPDLIAELLRLA